MIVALDPDSPTPPAEQLVAQIAASIQAGELDVGERLPTIRGLAADLGLAPGTVAKAYGELERDGWIRTQGRRGTTVADRDSTAEDRRLAAAADKLADLATSAGLGVTDAHRALDLAIARLGRRPDPT
jgi:DNA-binding transcriptional regulator YhcF (GntR family)